MKEGGASRHSFKKFLSQSTKKFGKGTFLLFTNILVSKNFMHKRWGMKQGGVSRYFVKKFLSQNIEKLRREHLRVSVISGAQRKMPRRGISRFSKENLLSHSTENFRMGTFLRFTKFLVPRKFYG